MPETPTTPSSEKPVADAPVSTTEELGRAHITVERPHLTRVMSTSDGYDVDMAVWGGNQWPNNERATASLSGLVAAVRSIGIARVEIRIEKRR